MLVYIDESGCTGFKLEKKSSPYFTIGMVVFSDLTEAEKASQNIRALKEKLSIKSEFKFSKSHPNVKDEFFKVACKSKFQLRALIVNKRNIYNSKIRANTKNFYNYCLKQLIQDDEGMLTGAHIRIDGKENRLFINTLSQYLNNQLPKNKIASIKFIDSKKDCLIQLADMSIGAIARAQETGRKDHDRWLQLLKKKGKINKITNFG